MDSRRSWFRLLLFLVVLVAVCDCVEFWRYPSLRRNRPTRAVPYIRPIRRHVVDFYPELRGRVTVVYQSDVELDVRWFRKADGLPYAEIPNMLSTAGDPNYEVTSAGSDDVRASTLIWKHVGSDFPYKFITCFSVNDTLFQYQFDTVIDRATRRGSTEDLVPPTALEEMYWVTIPPPAMFFNYRGHFRVTCAAMLAPEVAEQHEFLQMYKTIIEPPAGSYVQYGRLFSTNCESMSKQRNDYAHSPGKYRYKGSRKQLPFGHTRYEVEVKVRNASREDQAMYVCLLERPHDRTYVSSWVSLRTLEGGPLVEILPCEGHESANGQSVLRRAEPFLVHMTHNESNCFSCRATGYPPPSITVLRNNQPIESSGNIHVDSHVNVGDGGLQEVTYTYFKPSSDDGGEYVCRASSEGKTAEVQFSVVVKQPD